VKSKEKALLVAELAKAKLAEGLLILDMRKVSDITDFFVIVSAASTKRCQTIAEHIEEGLHKAGEPISSMEGRKEGLWILVDAYDVVAHVFYGDTRKFYNLEGLWGDAPRISLCQKKRKTSSSKKTSRKK